MHSPRTVMSVSNDSTMLRIIPHDPSNHSFVLGTSSTLFNQVLLNLPPGNVSKAQEILTGVLETISKDEEDIALYPNPFKAINGTANAASTWPNLTLVDGVH